MNKKKKCGMLLLMAALFLAGCAELQDLRQTKTANESRIAELEKQNNDLKDTYYNLKVEREKEQVKSRSQIELLQKDVETLKESRSDREETLRQENFNLRRDLQTLTTQIQTSKEDLAKLKTEYDKTTAQHDAVKIQSESNDKKNESERNILSSEISSLKEKIQKLEQDVSEKEKLIMDLNARISGKEKEIEEQKSQLEKYQSSELQKQETLKSQTALKEAESRIAKNLESEQGSGMIQLFMNERGLVIRLFTDELFNKETVLISETSKPLLVKISNLLNNYSEYKIDVEGHTDNTPILNLPFVDNLALSSARADHVVRFLIEEGKVASERVKSISCSFFHPAETNKTPEGRRLNRRVEIILHD